MPSKGIQGRQGAKSAEARAGAFTRDRITHLWREAMEQAKIDREAVLEIPAAFSPQECCERRL